MKSEFDPANPNSGHGHVYPRPDGERARCGGPDICAYCAEDRARKQAARQQAVPIERTHWAETSPGLADQYRAEAMAARRALGLAEDSEEVAPVDITQGIQVLAATQPEQPNLKLAYLEGWSMGWTTRHTDSGNDNRVAPWSPPMNDAEQDWLRSEANQGIAAAPQAEQVVDQNEQVEFDAYAKLRFPIAERQDSLGAYSRAMRNTAREAWVEALAYRAASTAPPAPDVSVLVHMFNQGYMRGHHDTVEGQFNDIQRSDMETYHEDLVLEIAEDYRGTKP